MTLAHRMLFAVVCSVAVATVYAGQPLLAQIGADLDLAPARLGWVITAGQLGYVVGLVFLVPLGDVFDRRTLIVGHLLLAAVGVTLAAFAGSVAMLLLGLAVAGVFAVVVQITVAYASALSSAHDRGRNLGFVTSGVVVGILGARVLSGALTSLWSWRAVYLGLAALLLLISGLVFRMLPPDPRDVRVRYLDVLRGLGQLLGERLFLARALTAFFLFASFGTLWSGLALPLTAAPWHLSALQIGLFGLVGLAGAAGATRAGRWADAGFGRIVTGGALLLLVLSWPAIGQATWSLGLLVVGVLVLDFAVQAVHVSNQLLLTAAHPTRTSSVIGGYMIFYSLGSGFGAAATTALYAAHGWAGSSILGAILACCAAAVWATNRVEASQSASGR